MTKVSDADVQRLRAVVGLGGNAPEKMPAKSKEVDISRALTQKSFAVDETKDSQLFVKIEEHDQITQALDEAKRDIKSIADTIELLARAEKLKADAIERMEHHVDSFERLLESIETRIVPPEDVLKQNATVIETHQATRLSQDLKTLKSTLEQLK